MPADDPGTQHLSSGESHGHGCTQPGGMASAGRSLRLLVFRLRVEIEFLVSAG